MDPLKTYSMFSTRHFVLLIALIWIFAQPVHAETARLAVAANFATTMPLLQERFEQRAAHKLKISYGPSGQFYAQIRQGAPYDVMLSADSRRPRLLEEEKLTLPGSRFTYAFGRLVLWAPKDKPSLEDGGILKSRTFTRLAIADPKVAPYGEAAREVLKHMNLWDELSTKLIRGHSIGQTFQMVSSGAVDLGFVALSQVKGGAGSTWIVPDDKYKPLQQQAVLLRHGADNPAAEQWLKFLRSQEALEIIIASGYGAPLTSSNDAD